MVFCLNYRFPAGNFAGAGIFFNNQLFLSFFGCFAAFLHLLVETTGCQSGNLRFPDIDLSLVLFYKVDI